MSTQPLDRSSGRSDGTFIVKDLRTDSPDGTDSLSGISTLSFRGGVKISLAGTVSLTQPSGGNLDRSGLGLVGDSNMGSSVTVSATVRSDAALFGGKTIFMQYAYSGSTPVIYKAIVHDGNQTSWTSWDTGTDVTQYCSVSSTASNLVRSQVDKEGKSLLHRLAEQRGSNVYVITKHSSSTLWGVCGKGNSGDKALDLLARNANETADAKGFKCPRCDEPADGLL